MERFLKAGLAPKEEIIKHNTIAFSQNVGKYKQRNINSI